MITTRARRAGAKTGGDETSRHRLSLNETAMEKISAALLLLALTAAACGTAYAPAGENGLKEGPGGATAAPAVTPSPGASPAEAVPANQNAAPPTQEPTRPPGEPEAASTSVPAPYAPARGVEPPGDRCIGPGSADPKVVLPVCPPQ
jgi:hypothetical protein